MPQSSDHMQSAGASGTKVTSLHTKDESAVSPKPTATNPSGSTQSESRGQQGMGK